jgi:hypothetical protein
MFSEGRFWNTFYSLLITEAVLFYLSNSPNVEEFLIVLAVTWTTHTNLNITLTVLTTINKTVYDSLMLTGLHGIQELDYSISK